MAIINCPECGKEISDKAEKCIYCGKVFEENIEPIQKQICTECGAELDNDATICSQCGCPINPHKKKTGFLKNKTLIIAIICILGISCIIVGINIVKSQQNKSKFNKYIDTLVLAETTMYEGAVNAEELTDLTSRVWHDAIYQEKDSITEKYVYVGDEYVDDFNTALLLLFLDDSTTEKIEKINENQEKVKEHMKQLQDVPEGLERCFDTITELYDSYGALTDLAIEPSGSYTSFTDAVNSAINDFSSAYKKLESQIPAKK